MNCGYSPAAVSSAPRYPLARVALGASFISTAGVFVKYLSAAGVGETAIGSWRALLGAALLFPLVRLSGASLWPGRRAVAMSCIAGFAFAVDLFVWHRSIVTVGVGVATILANTQIFWTTILARFIYGDRVSRRFGACAAAAFAGVVLLIGVGSEVDFSPEYVTGVAFGMITGVAYAGYVLAMQRASRLQDRGPHSGGAPSPVARAMVTLSWASLSTGTLLLLAALVEGNPLPPPTVGNWLLLAGLALVPQVLGWMAITSGLHEVPAARGALVLLVQPTLATVWGVVFFGEMLSALQIAGAFITLAAVYVGARERT